MPAGQGFRIEPFLVDSSDVRMIEDYINREQFLRRSWDEQETRHRRFELTPIRPKITKVLSKKRAIARRVITELKARHRSNLLAVGITGSVARGTAEKFSDIDLLLIVKRIPDDIPNPRIVDGTYCSYNYETWRSAVSKLEQPSPYFPEILGGFTKIMPLYDHMGLLPSLEAKAQSVPAETSRRSAELALLESFEDFCRAKNAYLSKDDIVLKDNVLAVTHSAALIIASLNCVPFQSDREIFKAYKGLPKLPHGSHRVEQLRYRNLNRRDLFKTLLDFYIDLVDFCKSEGINFPVDEKTLKAM